ncbi:H-NS histone family protein [Rosenbergiella australiborealis]|uniref:DNA-binding protein n=1 Tax=Rosenbergiella australiborealis TaxID=1544696 RepID=A0ABS5T1Y9_9GAMM|nr:H-NS family nucleoid-associated regulatory protein [Rosenbergiella australiborealis]MBT0726326.1 H-NS histone family protein [Rosenbergiella australiborealis]
MSNQLLTLTSLRHLRAEARNFSVETLNDILDKFTAIVEEHREESVSEGAQAAEHAKKLDKIREMMLSEGVDISELMAEGPEVDAKKNPRRKRPAKYQYTDQSGHIQTWTGQGRTPVVIQRALSQGDTLESFLITD